MGKPRRNRETSFFGLLLYAICSCILVPNLCPAQTLTWQTYQHDPQHTGRSAFAGPTNPALKWQFDANGVTGEWTYIGTPAISSDGTIYLPAGKINDADTTGFLYAIDPEGNLKWRVDLERFPGSTCPAVGVDGTVYIHCIGKANIADLETLRALKPDGTTKWVFSFNEGAAVLNGYVNSAPVVGSDGTVYVGSPDTRFYAIGPDGSMKWRKTVTGSMISSAPAIAHSGAILINDSMRLSAFTPQGDSIWTRELGTTGESSDASASVGTDGTIYIGKSHTMYALDPNDGITKWTFQDDGIYNYIDTPPALGSDGTVYFCNDGLYAIGQDGALRWKFKGSQFAEDQSHIAPTIDASGVVYWRGLSTTYAINPDGTERWHLDLPANQQHSAGGIVVANDGTLYIPTRTGWLYAYGEKALAAQAVGDFDGDGRVDFADFFLFADAFGTADVRYDLDGDGSVDFSDFFMFADAFGASTK